MWSLSNVDFNQNSLNPGAVVIDLDGTLLDNRSVISERNRMAILKLVNRGIPVIIATSRSERSTGSICGPEIRSKCTLVVLNGAIGRAANPLSGSVIETIPSNIAVDIVNIILKLDPDIRVTIELDGFLFGANWDASPELLWQLNSATTDVILPFNEALRRNPAKIAARCISHDLSELSRHISQKFSGLVNVIPSNQNTFLNIVSSRASKSATVNRLLKSKNIEMQKVIAFGDDMPDYDLLCACGYPVAMANAVPEIKAICRYQTLSNDEDGVGIFLEKLMENNSG